VPRGSSVIGRHGNRRPEDWIREAGFVEVMRGAMVVFGKIHGEDKE
jgi:hypothetical protein